VAVDSIVYLLDKGEAVCATFSDLRKAFDPLDHCMLQQRLPVVSVPANTQHWAYLTGLNLLHMY